VKVLVLDTSALIMGLDPMSLEFETYSVPEVTAELREQTSASYRLAMSISSGKLQIRTPTNTSLQEVLDMAKTLGDRIALSAADVNVLALALDLHKDGREAIVVSDDYAIQNVAEGIGLSHQSLATLGIRRKFNWVHYCPACFRQYSHEIQVCQVCGTQLKRKPSRKRSVKRRRVVYE
jgi:UPF0271 protein